MAQSKPLTTKDLVLIFGVTPMTILNWRKAEEGSRKKPLPCKIKGRSVEFNAFRVKAWANSNGVPMEHDPLDVAEGTHLTKAKPGPKPKAEAAKGNTVKPSPASVKLADALYGKKKPARTAAWKKAIDRDVRRSVEAPKARVH